MKRPPLIITGLLSVFALAFLFKPALAHPPSELKVEYNQDTHTLHVEMKHVIGSTYDPDHIRKIEIYKNQEDPVIKYIPKQTTPTTQVDDIALMAKPGDAIRVVAYSSRGGSAEATVTVPEPEEPAP